MTWESAWCSATFAYQLLDWFQKKVRDDSYKELHMGKNLLECYVFLLI